jgi:hypothetical protein
MDIRLQCLQYAAVIVGGTATLARRCGVTQETVMRWLQTGEVPEFAFTIAATVYSSGSDEQLSFAKAYLASQSGALP